VLWACPSRVLQLLASTTQAEAGKSTQRREDVEVDTRDFERTPRVVATGETPYLRLEGARARLYGDKGATQGWSVHNFVLLEVIDPGGRVVGSAAIGFSEGVVLGKEQVDNLGRMSFTFEPGEVDLTPKLPESEPFKLRVTALDYSGAGRVSDLFVVLDNAGARRGAEDDLRGQ
jgi:hypothetical protein